MTTIIAMRTLGPVAIVALALAAAPASAQAPTGKPWRHGLLSPKADAGFLQDNNYVGRPVDVQMTRDGALLVSDDYAGAVYRISYSAPPPATQVPAVRR